MNSRELTRPTRMSGEERRAAILEASCKLFAEKGFRGTTTRELAAAVGVTEPVLYEHFRTKSELYSAIIEAKAKGGVEALTGLEHRFHQANDDPGFFHALADSIVDWYSDDKDFIRLLLYSSLEGHELKDLFHERSCECFHIVSNYIARRQSEGALRSEMDSRVAARGFFGIVAHYALTAIVFEATPLPFKPKIAIRQMVDIFVSGMCIQEENRK
ncbi:MAG: TetR/AcrR family transcriptional regulator [Bryobacteraceae bacterium]|nr:TetR/AcrR family transcriptional regulator [Bryobacteraceae bacterium]